jgi:hypothetical protein
MMCPTQKYPNLIEHKPNEDRKGNIRTPGEGDIITDSDLPSAMESRKEDSFEIFILTNAMP